MHAPKEIIDFLESILGIYLSDIRHKERSAFILCDNLIEISCKKRIKERIPKDNTERNFPNSISDAKIRGELKKDLLYRHQIRNDMQHAKLGMTVDNQYCAYAIIGVVKVLKKLWGKYAMDNVSGWLPCALRIVELYSNSSHQSKVKMFEDKLLRNTDWNKDSMEDNSIGRRLPNKNEIIIEVGAKNYWPLLVRERTDQVNQCLDEILN